MYAYIIKWFPSHLQRTRRICLFLWNSKASCLLFAFVCYSHLLVFLQDPTEISILPFYFISVRLYEFRLFLFYIYAITFWSLWKYKTSFASLIIYKCLNSNILDRLYISRKLSISAVWLSKQWSFSSLHS